MSSTLRTVVRSFLLTVQESEGLDLDIATLRAGAHNLLIDSSKGTYYIAEVPDFQLFLYPNGPLAGNHSNSLRDKTFEFDSKV